MGAMFRSEEMALTQLFLQQEVAYQAMSELGELGVVQFRDLNEEVNAFQKKFVNEVRRCSEMERKLRYVEAEIKKNNVKLSPLSESPKAPNTREIQELESHLDKTEAEAKSLSCSSVQLKKDLLELTEISQVLEKIQGFSMDQDDGQDSVNRALIPEDSHNVSMRGRLGFITGVIDRERVAGFETMLWRISRGNVLLKQADIDKPLIDPQTGGELKKTVFAAFFQGEQLRTRIRKICAGYHATIYPCPDLSGERQKMLQEVKTRLEDLKTVLNQTEDHLQRVLNTVAQELPSWSVMVVKMKAIYHTLNMCNMDVSEKCLIAECWIPTSDIPVVQKMLNEGSAAAGSSVKSFLNVINTSESPPTFNRTNKFTQGFQNLIEAYGVASYREVNPALYTIVTFPFLFACMFGDIGHAIILILIVLPMIIFEKILEKIPGEIFQLFFGGRYIMLMMGLFSMYTGFFYNDVFSKSVNIFGSAWTNNLTSYDFEKVNGELTTLDPSYDYGKIPYPAGVDPIWQFAKNKIIFLNSYKMKLSIIFGVAHMIFGVCLTVVNSKHFKKMENILLDFVPQMLFLLCLFLWLVIMMFMKWIMFTPEREDPIYGSSCAPSVLIFFINMLLFKENIPPTGCKVYMFEGQYPLQMVLVFVGLLCIPVLLLGKPLYVLYKRKRARNHVGGDVNRGMEMQPEVLELSQSRNIQEEEEEEEPMSEIFIYQAIHTIEYVLSTISHTASYLRLWALSLAHAQLSEVLWNMVMHNGLGSDSYIGGVMIYLLFYPWSFLTVGILVQIEGLSAFLHTLRLHWVEFMSKFYSGLGYPFQPFDFKKILKETNEE